MGRVTHVQEYDTELWIVFPSMPTWLHTFYQVCKSQSYEQIIETLCFLKGEPRKHRQAARRIVAHVRALSLPDTDVNSTSPGSKMNKLLQEAEELIARGSWDESTSPKNIQTILNLCHDAAQSIPSVYSVLDKQELFRLTALHAMTDDSAEDEDAFQRLQNFKAQLLKQLPGRQGAALSRDEAIQVTAQQIAELSSLSDEIRTLIAALLTRHTRQGAYARHSPEFAASLLLTRLQHDLAGVKLLVNDQRPHQALTLVAAMFEMSYVIGYIGQHTSRAAKWFSLAEDRTLGTVKELIDGTLKNRYTRPVLNTAEREAQKQRIYQDYANLCRFKHARAEAVEIGAGDFTSAGQFTLRMESSGDYLETWTSMVALYQGCLFTLNAFEFFLYFHLQDPDLKAAHADLAERVELHAIRDQATAEALGIPELKRRLETAET